MDSYIDNPHQGFEECAQVFLDKYERLTAEQGSSSTRRTNNTQQKGKGTGKTNTMPKSAYVDKETYKIFIKEWRLPAEKWNSLTSAQQKALQKIREQRGPKLIHQFPALIMTNQWSTNLRHLNPVSTNWFLHFQVVVKPTPPLPTPLQHPAPTSGI